MEATWLVHHVGPDDSFMSACRELFDLLVGAQRERPGELRRLEVTIDDAHRLKIDDGQPGPWNADMLLLQTHFVLEVLGPYLTEVRMPLGRYVQDGQRDDLPGTVELLLDDVA